MFILMAISSQEAFQAAYDREAPAIFGVAQRLPGDDRPGHGPGGRAAATLDGFGFGAGTLLLVPFMLFFLLYPNWGSTLYGEVRGAGDFRKVLNGMLGGLWATAGLAVVFVFLAAKTFGWTFFNASNGTYVNYAYGYTTEVAGRPDLGLPAACSPRT